MPLIVEAWNKKEEKDEIIGIMKLYLNSIPQLVLN